MKSTNENRLRDIIDHYDFKLYQDQSLITGKELLESANSFIGEHPELSNSVVALEEVNLSKFIMLLIALDGKAKKILILPSKHDDYKSAAEQEESAANYLITNNTLTCLQHSEYLENTINSVDTEWCIFTSGTTGSPKLIKHTLKSLVGKLGKKKSTTSNAWGILYDHARFAGLQVVLQTLISGDTLVHPGVRYGSIPNDFFFSKVICLSATPSMWRKLLMYDKITTVQFKVITLGGEIADQPLLTRLRDTFPKAKLVHIYASTEAGVGLKITDGKAGFPVSWLNERDDIDISPHNTLMIKLDNLSTGKEIERRTDSHGFFDTQDLIGLKNDRFIFLGRVNGVINVGGNKVNPILVEEIVRELDYVQEVVVFGKKNSIIGQVVAANIVLSEKAIKEIAYKNILLHCKSRLSIHEVPAHIYFVKDINLTSTGKTARHEK